MKALFSFFFVLLNSQLLFAQLANPKFQPDTIYMVTNYQYSAVDRRIFFDYENVNSNGEYGWPNKFTNSSAVSFSTVTGNWRYFTIRSNTKVGYSEVEFRLQDPVGTVSEPVIFPIYVMNSQHDSLSSLINNSFYKRGIPGNKWLLLSIPITDVFIEHKTLFSFLATGSNAFRLYSLQENGKTINVSNEDSLFFKEGAAYWFKTTATEEKFNLKISFTGSRRTVQGTNYNAKKGWRLMGSPYDYPVFWRSENNAARIWSFNPDTQTWRELSKLEMVYPWTAYAVYSVEEENVMFYHRFGANYAVTNPAKKANPILANGELVINGESLRFGFSRESEDGLDINDDPLMPKSPDISSLPAYWKQENRALISDFRSEQHLEDETQIHTWNLVLPKGNHELNLRELGGFGFDTEIILTGENEFIKLEKDKVVQLKTNSEKIFTLHIGKRERLQTEIKPEKPLLHSVYPNPFNPTTTLRFSLPEKANVNVFWFDVSGRMIKTDNQGLLNSGFHEVQLNGSSLASGIYFIRIQINGKFELGKKITLLK